MKSRVTQKSIAKEAGVSHMTVSLALRSHPSIPEATQKRIKDICDRLGYVPDPMLSSLSAYRTSMRPQAYQSNLGWIHTRTDQLPPTWDFSLYHKGAVLRAKTHGYNLEEIRLADIDYNPRRLTSMLKAKGITALLLPPFPRAGAELRIDFSHISAVRFGFSYNYPRLHTVVNSQFRTALLTVQNIIAQGYKRIGIILNHDQDVRTNWNFLGGYLAGQQVLDPNDRIAPFYPLSSTVIEIRDWILQNRLTCVIGLGQWELIRNSGINLGYVDLSVSLEDKILTGMHQNPLQTGATAVDFLNSMIHRGEVGVPDNPVTILTDSTWRSGATLPYYTEKAGAPLAT